MGGAFWRVARGGVRLAHRERRLAVRAIAWLAVAHGVMRALPYAPARRLLDRISAPGRRRMRISPDECARAMARAACLLPATTCLSRALAARCLLRRAGTASAVHIGIATDAPTFRAHAWLESNGVIVTGATGHTHTRLV